MRCEAVRKSANLAGRCLDVFATVKSSILMATNIEDLEMILWKRHASVSECLKPCSFIRETSSQVCLSGLKFGVEVFHAFKSFEVMFIGYVEGRALSHIDEFFPLWSKRS